jgi:hypothetical protein
LEGREGASLNGNKIHFPGETEKKERHNIAWEVAFYPFIRRRPAFLSFSFPFAWRSEWVWKILSIIKKYKYPDPLTAAGKIRKEKEKEAGPCQPNIWRNTCWPGRENTRNSLWKTPPSQSSMLQMLSLCEVDRRKGLGIWMVAQRLFSLGIRAPTIQIPPLPQQFPGAPLERNRKGIWWEAHGSWGLLVGSGQSFPSPHSTPSFHSLTTRSNSNKGQTLGW